jgi:hypothetical protein
MRRNHNLFELAASEQSCANWQTVRARSGKRCGAAYKINRLSGRWRSRGGTASCNILDLALPREVHETNIFNGLHKGLGKDCPIDLQGVSESPPNLRRRLPKGPT